jgi:phosphatidylinositol 4-kinase
MSHSFESLTNRSRWSFGGNRHQIKAETHVLSDIRKYLQFAPSAGAPAEPSLKSLKGKQELLLALLDNEQTRLMVWLFPLNYEKRHHFTSGQHSKGIPDVSSPSSSRCHFLTSQAAVSGLLKTAWAENPAIAVHLVQRFQSVQLAQEVRWLALNFPHKVLDEPDALEILLGSQLPNDVSFQMKVCRPVQL